MNSYFMKRISLFRVEFGMKLKVELYSAGGKLNILTNCLNFSASECLIDNNCNPITFIRERISFYCCCWRFVSRCKLGSSCAPLMSPATVLRLSR